MENEKPFQFTLILSGVDEDTPELEDALYQAGCDDALINSKNGTVYLDFDRVANDLEEGILSAIQQIESGNINAKVVGVEPSYLVNMSEIARRANITRQHISLLAKGARGDYTFPKPVMRLDEKSSLWRWKEVAQWLYEHKHLSDKSEVNMAQLIEDINLALEFRRGNEENYHHRYKLLKTLNKNFNPALNDSLCNKHE